MAAQDKVVLYPPGLEAMAAQLCDALGVSTPLCTAQLTNSPSASPTLCWERFPSGDPNVKVRIDAIRDRDVVVILNMDSNEYQFEQLSLLLLLQRFEVPDPLPEYAKNKWKRSLADGKFSVGSAASISVVVPWYRYCQMERTCRWELGGEDRKWNNAVADGPFVDMPTCASFAALMSAAPCEAVPRRIPKRLLFVDIHEYSDLERVLTASGHWANATRDYDLVSGSGTYFASAFRMFLESYYLPSLREVRASFVVFPDHGAPRRFYTMVHAAVKGIALENILWIAKTRVGAQISQAETLFYLDGSGVEQVRAQLPADANVLIADDFTNSGSTLFGAAQIVRKLASGSIEVGAYVSHFVAKYDRATVTKFVDKLYGGSLDTFSCTDSIPKVVRWLEEDVAAKGGASRATLVKLAPLVAQWLKQSEEPEGIHCSLM